MFLAMWSLVHWHGDTSILDAHLLIIALEIGHRRRSRKSPRQASDARLDAKMVQDDLNN
jgi:hypothetical protein